VAARERLVADLEPLVAATYNRLAGAEGAPALVRQAYQRSWTGDLLDALSSSRKDDLRRGVNTVGPHRDELILLLEGREARSHASQGEQRCLALALRLAIHELVRSKTDLRPTLLLDDVFSELDPVRSKALVAELPTGQSLLTTAAPLPDGIDVTRVVQVGDLVR
jgi:DNA replication and repair protein RecF